MAGEDKICEKIFSLFIVYTLGAAGEAWEMTHDDTLTTFFSTSDFGRVSQSRWSGLWFLTFHMWVKIFVENFSIFHFSYL